MSCHPSISWICEDWRQKLLFSAHKFISRWCGSSIKNRFGTKVLLFSIQQICKIILKAKSVISTENENEIWLDKRRTWYQKFNCSDNFQNIWSISKTWIRMIGDVATNAIRFRKHLQKENMRSGNKSKHWQHLHLNLEELIGRS